MKRIFKTLAKSILAILFLTLIVPTNVFAANQEDYYDEAMIYFNEACSGCTDYLYEELDSILRDTGFKTIEYKDYVNEPEYRKELNSIVEELDIPFELQSHIMAFVGNNLLDGDEVNTSNIKVVLAGHIPEEYTHLLIETDNLQESEMMLIFQDKMPNMEEVNDYKAWGFVGPIKTYDIDEDIKTYIDWFRENREGFEEKDDREESWQVSKLLPAILITGFLDGINPCAIAVLLLFISYLFTIKKARKGILKMGVIYILAVFLAYILIGVGLMKAVLITGVPHFMAWVGSIAVIVLGLVNILNYFFPKFPIKFKIPDFSKGVISEYMYKATMPAAFILGFVVGLCTFPCSGGPYVAIIGLLSTQTDWLKGFMYLIIYNIMFVSPLIVLLGLAGNKFTTDKLMKWESSKSKYIHIISGLFMVLLGLFIIIFFI